MVIFYPILACTGLYWSYDWWRNGTFKVLGVERPQPEMQANAGITVGEGRPAVSEASCGKASRQVANAVLVVKASEGLALKATVRALDQSWIGFNTEFSDKYSTVTFNLPKKPDGEL